MSLASAISKAGLMLLGGFHPGRDADHLPPDTATFLLLGPSADGFWPRVTASPEFADGAPDPLDRWSQRVIGGLAAAHHGTALFPFGGPPWLPFLGWAQQAGLTQSPVGMLVHPQAGLMVSIRGALALRERLDLPSLGPGPCLPCPAPCRTACPVDALHGDRYDADRCRSHVASPKGRDCRESGCRARRACPLSAGAGRSHAQSAYHMSLFLGVR